MIALEVREFVFDRDDDHCRYCGVRLVSSGPGYAPFRTIDHVVPRSLGGSDDVDNLVAACAPCNARKGNRPAEWLLERLVVL